MTDSETIFVIIGFLTGRLAKTITLNLEKENGDY